MRCVSGRLGRKPLFAPRGAVATSQPLAAGAGLAVLRKGGNAVDAAVATAVALTVVQPGSNDIGSDLFALVWDGTKLHGPNASGRAPAALTRELVVERGAVDAPSAAAGGGQRRGERFMPVRGWLPVTVPGAPKGWRDLHEAFGALPFEELFVDAIAFAENGYPVSPTVAAHWSHSVTGTQAGLDGPEFAEWSRVFAPGGRAPRAGERWSNPDAARTLRKIADTGAKAFYQGEIAEKVAEFAARTGGLLTAEDLAAHTSTWVDHVINALKPFEASRLRRPAPLCFSRTAATISAPRSYSAIIGPIVSGGCCRSPSIITTASADGSMWSRPAVSAVWWPQFRASERTVTRGSSSAMRFKIASVPSRLPSSTKTSVKVTARRSSCWRTRS